MTTPTPGEEETRNPTEMPELDAPLHLPSAREAALRYDRLTDAEVWPDQDEAFTRSYTFAAHRSARHLPAALAEVASLRTQLAEARAEVDERDEWATSLAAALEVPEDLDPYFGIARVARENQRYLVEAAAEEARLRPVVEAAEAWRDGEGGTDLLVAAVDTYRKDKGQ